MLGIYVVVPATKYNVVVCTFSCLFPNNIQRLEFWDRGTAGLMCPLDLPQGDGILRDRSALVVSHGGAHVLKLTVQRCHELIRYYPELKKVFRVSNQILDGRHPTSLTTIMAK